MIGRALVLGFVAVVSFVLFADPALAQTQVPEGFSDELVTGAEAPTALAFLPDGRMVVAGRPGKLFVYENGEMKPKPALDIRYKVCSNSERGLLGIAVDPDFATNRFVYAYYTKKNGDSCDGNEVNRVSRFILSDDNTVTGEKILINNIQSPAGNHNGGDVGFGKDGYLYVTVGDGGRDYAGDSGGAGQNDAARDKHVMLGKVLRITRDGGIPSSNPHTGTNSGRCNVTGKTTKGNWCREIYATGLRNPFRFAFDPNAADTRFFINDVGQRAWEEINESRSGADYGWNFCEGRHDNPDRAGDVNCANSYTPPIHEYSHNKTGCSSITGAAFVPNDQWPTGSTLAEKYDESYLYGDYVCNKIFKLTPKTGGGYARTEFATGLGRGGPVHMEFGPYGEGQALYYATYANGGEIRRIAHSFTNWSPTAMLKADPTYGKDLPLTVNFDGSGSKDRNTGDSLTYLWDFDGDGTVDLETDVPTVTKNYEIADTFMATLTVRDQRGAESTPAEVRIDAGNTPPEPKINAPEEELPFKVGQEIALRGTATDGEDGDLAPESLEWEVLRHHNNDHTHPFRSDTGAGMTFTAPEPEDLFATGAGNYLEVRLTATDSKGLTKTVTRNVQPQRVNLSFGSSPTGLKLRINGRNVKTPRTLTSWPSYRLNIVAPSQENSSRLYAFSRWSDGGEASHTITTPDANASYAANFKEVARPSSLRLKSSKSLIRYNGRVRLSGRLYAVTGPIKGKRVTVWRSVNRGRNWIPDGRAVYDTGSRTYKATRRLKRNTLYQMRFSGDSSFKAVRSSSVMVKAKAYLSKPAVRDVVQRGDYFSVRGYLKPRHSGKTRLDFFQYKNGKWRLYKKIYAKNRPRDSYTTYYRRYKLPETGKWYVKAYHKDASHAASWSRRETFRVKR